MATNDPLGYCAAELRRHDLDRYLCSLYSGKQARNGLIALYALNLELVRIGEQVSEPLLGEIRFEWWRETIDGIRAGRPQEHPIALALTSTGIVPDLDRETLGQLIAARARDLEPWSPEDRLSLEAYAEATAAGLNHLVLDALAIRGEVPHRAARHVGIAWSLVGVIRATGLLARAGRCLVPVALRERTGLSDRAVEDPRNREGLRAAISNMADWAAEHLATAQKLSVCRNALPAVLSGALTKLYLDRLTQAAFDPFDRRLAVGPLTRQASLTALWVRGWR